MRDPVSRLLSVFVHTLNFIRKPFKISTDGGGEGREERRRRRRGEEGEEEGEEDGDNHDQILCKNAVTEGLQWRLLIGSSSSIGVREDCRASATLQHIAAHRTSQGTPAMGQRWIVQHISGGTHSRQS